MEKRCTIEGCENPAEIKRQYCKFHLPVNEQTLSFEEYNAEIFIRLAQGKPNFDKYIFPGPIDFSGVTELPSGLSFKYAEFYGTADFSNLTFSGKTNFWNVYFGGGAKFENTIFNGEVIFIKSRFTGSFNHLRGDLSASFIDSVFNADASFRESNFSGSTSWLNSKFGGNLTLFSYCEFSGTSTDFDGMSFTSGDVSFSNSRFPNGIVNFSNCRFVGGNALFWNTEFSGGFVKFANIRIAKSIRLGHITISDKLDFSDVQFEPNASFHLIDPRFSNNLNVTPRITFRRVQFNPYTTFFEGIKAGKDFEDKKPVEKPLIIFRESYLRNVYFTESDISLLSFFKSAFFEEALFTSSKWPFSFRLLFKYFVLRERNKICEESIYDDLKKRNEFILSDIEFPENYWEISELYMRLKAAADKAKNYHMASDFYFSEFEMKRLAMIEEYKKGKNILEKLFFTFKRYLYGAYRVFAGYGQKPQQSFGWFWVLSFVFAILHLFNGIKTPVGAAINYDWRIALPINFATLNDIGSAFKFSLHHALPVSYLPYLKEEYELLDHGTFDILLSLCNSAVLIMLIIFTGIGLKRHFRRF